MPERPNLRRRLASSTSAMECVKGRCMRIRTGRSTRDHEERTHQPPQLLVVLPCIDCVLLS
jgi:hypothetical protein